MWKYQSLYISVANKTTNAWRTNVQRHEVSRGITGLILIGGHADPNPVMGDKLPWKNAQKGKKNSSGIINKTA